MDLNLTADEEDTGSVPGPGRFQVLWDKLSLCATDTEPTPQNLCSTAREATTTRSCSRQQRPRATKNKEIKFKEFKHPLPTSRAQIIYLHFLEVLYFWFLCLGLWSISKSLLCVMWGRGWGSYFYVCLSIFVLKTFLLPKVHRAHFLKKSIGHTYLDLFLGSLFCPIDLDICPHTSSMLLLHSRA